jgi:hypothetical protein
MSVRQLNQLQNLDLEIESAEKSSAAAQAKLNENEELRRAKAILAEHQAELDALLRQQKETDWSISDITGKMTVTNESLYSGRVRNPKELSGLQHELVALKKQRDPLEEIAMGLMEKIEVAQKQIQKIEEDLKSLESRLGEEHARLRSHIEELGAKLTSLREERNRVVSSITPEEIRFYSEIKIRRGVAVANVDKGTCGRCRISLSSAELQRARSGKLTQCSSCSRILYYE